jgi:gliding motility-associated-like protein
VVDPIPLLDFNTLNTSTCTFPFPVTFNDNSSGPILKRTWDFGDGSSQIDNPPFSSNVSHTYNKEGVFSVRLTLTTDKNCSVSKLIPNMVSIIAPKILKQNLPDSGCVPFVLEPKIQFDNPSQLTSWDWEYKDRNGNLLLSSNASSPPSFTINDSGIYRVDLKVTTQDGCQKSYFWDVKAGKVPKDFDFEASPLDDCASQTFIFKFKELAPDYLTGYTWVFNQKDTVRQKNPSKKFKKIEPVDVQLIVFQYGCSKEITKNDYVNVKGVVSAFSVLNDCSAPYERVVVDNSLGNIQNWVLNFGDGYTENYTTKQNSIKHTYASPGQYTVSLKVSDGVCDYIDSVIVRLADEQKVDFSFDKFPLCVSDTFMLINAVVDNSQFIKSYNWDLGCGFNGPGNSKSLKIKFSDLCKYSSNGGRGMYKMQLRIVDANNCVISSPIKNVMVGGPVADYSTLSPVTGCTNLPVNFKDNTSTDGSTPIVSRLWTFGDGTAPKNILSGQVSHVYSKDGIFPVTLTVTDAVGCTSTKSGINIATSDPDIDVFSFETVSCLNKNIQLEAKSSATLVSYVWNLGDGIIKNNVANPRVSYSAVGLKTIVLTVKDLLGCEKTITKSNFLTIDMPMATFVADKLVSDCPPFNANFSFNGNFAESFEWDFGDGTTSALKDPSHLYQQSGNYPVTLTVTSPGGCVATSSSPVVLQVKGPRGAVAFKPTLCEPYNAEFNITHENTDYVFIDYGDGNVSGNIPVADMIPYSYTDTGLYQPNVFLLNTNGCTVFLKSPNDIRTVSLEPKFTPDINFMCDNGRVEFTDRTLANEKLVSWQWDFGDTKTGVGPRPANFYSRPGIYSVKLNVISQSGCQKSLTRSSIIEVQARPDIGIQSNKAIICEDDIIQFTGIEVVPNNSPTVSWFWDFTNGNSATGQFPPPQQFRKGGIYPFRLYATNSKGCSDTLFQNFTVNPNPIVDAGADIVFCLGKPVSLTPQGGLSYQWDQAPGISCTNCTSPTINPSSDAVYRVKGISSLGCFAYDSVRVKVIQPSTIKAIADTLVCEGQSVQLTSSGTELVSWSPATGLSRTDVFSPIAKPSQTITYTVTGKDIYNCFTTKDDVVVRVIPNPKVDVGNDTTVKAGYPFTINPSYSNDVARVQWVPSLFLNCSNCKTPVSTPSYSATYTVFAYTPEGCMSKDVINVFVTCTKDNLFIPTTFSPNGDGMNEVFFPRGRGIEKIRSMKVFSRWGQLIYEKQNFLANDQSAGWDGRKAGQYVTPDVYVYMIELVCENGNIITLKGDVTLIR